MMKKIYNRLLIVIMLLTMSLTVTAASDDATILQIYINEQTMTAFSPYGLQSDSLFCKVANQNAQITSSGFLTDEEALIQTTILLDISTSIPSAMRDDVISMLNKMVENKSANEEYKVVVFGEEITTLCDFSSDRYDLANIIDQIEFNGLQSKIYDAIYNTLPQIAPIDQKPTFYRTVVITDGVDDTASGITKEELYIKLQSETYPVDAVAVSTSETAENRELSAIARMSHGRYFAITPSVDVTSLAEMLRVNEYSYMTAIVPAVLLDGTTRQVDIGDGVGSISIDAKFPVWNAPVTEPPSTAAPEPATPPAMELSAASEVTNPPLSEDAHKTVTHTYDEYAIVFYIGIAVVIIVFIAIIIAIAIIRSKKRKKDTILHTPISYGSIAENYAEKTEFVSEVNHNDLQYTMKLSNANDPRQTWTLPVTGEILIGRAEHCLVKLDDKSVSREQCKITAKGNGLVVAHMSSTNKTSLNGIALTESSSIQSGDTLKFGRIMLQVDYIQALGSPLQRQEQPQYSDKGKTESIF
jgi:hypothetical protein